MPTDEFGRGASYDLCREVAINEDQAARKYYEEIEKAVSLLLEDSDRDAAFSHSTEELVQRNDVKLSQLKMDIEAEIRRKLGDIRLALNRRSASLDRFTIVLFGRTMAGKSTLREALTGGKGDSIGEGAQRFTRDIEEYTWRDLRFLDTPGIGAYEGRADRETAMMALDESDLVLFLLSSDSIQEESFKGMEEVHHRNKATVFILNVKRDITKGVLQRRFLSDPMKSLGREATKGHYKRIRFLAEKLHDIRALKIIPVHAQAAFMASLPDNKSRARQLGDASNIRKVSRTIEEEVSKRGPIRRIQATLDCIVCGGTDLVKLLRDRARAIRELAEVQEKKFSELEAWFDTYERNVHIRIEAFAINLFNPIKQSAASFVDENVEKKNIDELWQKHCGRFNIRSKADAFSRNIKLELDIKLKDFQREVEFEMDLMNNLEIPAPNRYSPWDYRRAVNWTSIGMGAITSLATADNLALVGAALYYSGLVSTPELPPVGTVLAISGAVLIGIGMLLPKHEVRLQKQKKKVVDDVLLSIFAKEIVLKKALQEWFRKDVALGVIQETQREIRGLNKAMRVIADLLDEAASTCETVIENTNKRLLVRTARFCRHRITESDLLRVERLPGAYFKATCGHIDEIDRVSNAVGEALNESVALVEKGSLTNMVTKALEPAGIEESSVQITDGSATVTVPKKEVARVVGVNGQNVELVERLLGMIVDVQRGGS